MPRWPSPGTVIVPGRLLAEITRSLPALAVEFSTDDDVVNLICGSAEFALFTLPADEYPALPAAAAAGRHGGRRRCSPRPSARSARRPAGTTRCPC